MRHNPDRLTAVLSGLIAAILALVPFHALLSVWLSSIFGHYTALRLWKEALLGLIVLGVIYLAFHRKLWRQIFSSSLLPGLIVVYAAATMLWGGVAYANHSVSAEALGYGLVINLRFLAFFMVVLVVSRQSDWLYRQWKKIVLIPAAVVVSFGLLQRLVLPYDVLKHVGYGAATIEPYQTIDNKLSYLRVQSTLRGANPLGAYLVVIVSLLTAVAVGWRRHLWKLALGMAGTALVLGFTYSRSAWLGAVVAVSAVVWLAALRTKRARRMMLAALAAVVLVGGSGLVALRHNDTFQNTVFHTDEHSRSATSSNFNRGWSMRQAALEVVSEPLGRGPGSAGPASVYNHRPARIAENYFLQIGQEVGWLGLGLFVAINGVAGWQLYLRRRDPLALGLLVSLLGLTLVNLLSHAWTDDTLGYLWWGLAGIACSQPATEGGKRET